MKTMKKNMLSALLAVSLFASGCASAQIPPDALLSVTFDSFRDANYALEVDASLKKSIHDKALLCTGKEASYATVADTNVLANIDADFTFSIWCAPESHTDWMRIFDFGTGTDQYIFLTSCAGGTQGKPRFVIKNGGYEQMLTGETALQLNQWSHLAIVRENGLTSMYLNGLLVGETTEIALSPQDLGTLTRNYLGKSQYETDAYYKGMIDDLRIYDYAWSLEEVQEVAADAYDSKTAADAAYRAQGIRLASRYDRYVIETDFYDAKNEKIYDADPGNHVTATVKVANNTITDRRANVKLYAVLQDGTKRLLDEKDTDLLQSSQTRQISFSVEAPADAKFLNAEVTDSGSGTVYDSGYLTISSSVVFPDASPEDSDATTTGVHDPAIFKDPAGGHYWVYSTHNVIFESEDLIHWTKHESEKIVVPQKSIDFIKRNYDTEPNATYWAPDILYVPEDTAHPYWLYISESCGIGGRNSVIGLIKSDSPNIFEGNYIDCGVVLASKEQDGYKTNAIDANLYIDTDGTRYIIWGSFWGGVQMAPLNADGTVAGVNYSSDAAILESCKNFGKTVFSAPGGIMGPEGPWLATNHEERYRYLFTSYGWLGTTYNIRVARSPLSITAENALVTPQLAFTDHNGNPVGDSYSGQLDKSVLWGYKMIGSYQLGDGLVYYGNGHNSVLHDSDGNWYLVQHSRKVPDSVAYLQVRKMLWTDAGWPVVSPLVYAGEQVQAIERSMLYGTWDLSSVGETIFNHGVTDVSKCAIGDADLPVLSSEVILKADGTLGSNLGTWTFDGDHTVKLYFTKDGDSGNYEFYKQGDVMTLYVLAGYDKDQRERALVMTGTNQKSIAQFAKKANAMADDTVPEPKSTQPVTLPKSSGGNPVLGFDGQGNRMFAGDPAALVVGDTVYLYAGHDVSPTNAYVMPEWVVYTSKDMVNWEYRNVIMKGWEISWASNPETAWASQVIGHRGKYYLYYCTLDRTSWNQFSIGVAVADAPEGPFRDIGKPLVPGPITDPAEGGHIDIDPTVWVETVNGTEHRYLAWGNGQFYVCELNEDMISIKDLNDDGRIDAQDVKRQEIRGLNGASFTEAPWLYKRGGKYYAFMAVNWHESMAYATADSPFGPWDYQGEIMAPTATSNTNHPSVIDFNGKTYFIYHNGSLPTGSGYRRSICVQELTFDAQGRVLPMTELSTGLAGTASRLKTADNRYVGHEVFVNPYDPGAYPLKKDLQIFDGSDNLHTAWEIKKAKYMPEQESYVSLQAVDKPGLYITALKGEIVLTQDADGTLGKSMTFKTVGALNGSGGVSFESVAYPGRYLTVSEGGLILSYGDFADASSFIVE